MARSYIKIENLLPDLLRDCPGVPRAVALHELRMAAIQFCIETRFWRENIVPIQTQMNIEVTEYEVFCLAPETQVVSMITLQADGRPLEAHTEDNLDRNETGWRSLTGVPKRFIAPSAAWIRPFPIAVDAVVTLTGKIAVAPTPTGNFLLDDLYNLHGSDIASLAKSRLMLMPNKPWSNENLAIYYGGMASRGQVKATTTASKNFSAAPQRGTKANWF